MTDIALKKKIQHTRLLSDAEKIELLVRFDELSYDDRKALEETIEGFDTQYAASSGVLKDEMQKGIAVLQEDVSEEEKVQTEDAIAVTQLGLGLL